VHSPRSTVALGLALVARIDLSDRTSTGADQYAK